MIIPYFFLGHGDDVALETIIDVDLADRGGKEDIDTEKVMEARNIKQGFSGFGDELDELGSGHSEGGELTDEEDLGGRSVEGQSSQDGAHCGTRNKNRKVATKAGLRRGNLARSNLELAKSVRMGISQADLVRTETGPVRVDTDAVRRGDRQEVCSGDDEVVITSLPERSKPHRKRKTKQDSKQDRLQANVKRKRTATSDGNYVYIILWIV